MTKILKISIVFFIAILFTIIIYFSFDQRKTYILSLGDDLSLGKTPFNTYNYSYIDYLINNNNYIINTSFMSENITYDDIYNRIYYDELIYDKGSYKNIKNIIRKSDIVILTANNNITFNKCEKNERIINEYLDNLFNKITNIADIIYNIKDLKIIVLTPYCYNYRAKTNDFINKYYKYKNITFINLNEIFDKTEDLPSPKLTYPSINGYYKIYNRINEILITS
jgi:hypothetical protein